MRQVERLSLAGELDELRIDGRLFSKHVEPGAGDLALAEALDSAASSMMPPAQVLTM